MHCQRPTRRGINSTADLRAWIKGPLNQLIPHRRAIVGIAAHAPNSYRIVQHESVGFDADYFADYVPRNPYNRSPLIERWVKQRTAQQVVTAELDDCYYQPWLRNAAKYGIGNVIMAGYEHGASSTFYMLKLFDVRIALTEAAALADLIVPVLKDVWTRIIDAEFDSPRTPVAGAPTVASGSVQPVAVLEANPVAQSTALPLSTGRLTAAQREILALLKQRKTNAEIAAALGKSPATIKTQVEAMLNRTGLPSRHMLACLDV